MAAKKKKRKRLPCGSKSADALKHAEALGYIRGWNACVNNPNEAADARRRR
jgi:hypothetical protein